MTGGRGGLSLYPSVEITILVQIVTERTEAERDLGMAAPLTLESMAWIVMRDSNIIVALRLMNGEISFTLTVL